MSVLVKGMEMPKSCESCPCKTSDAFGGLGCQATGYIPLRKANQDRPDWCPFVPVPSHGRLIDADALEDRCSRQARDEWNKSTGTNWGYAYATFESDVEDAPTIIEAEEEEVEENE